MGITIPLKVSLDKKLCEAGCFFNLKKKSKRVQIRCWELLGKVFVSEILKLR